MTRKKTAFKDLPATAFIRDNYLLCLIFIAGFLLRIYDIGAESIWYDEAISVAVAKLGFVEHLRWIAEVDDNNPPLFYTLLHLWIPVFGDSEASVRIPSAIFGSLSILAIYALGKLLFDKKTGLVASSLLAVSIFSIMFSQEARSYSLMALTAILSFYFLLRLTMSKKWIYAAAYVISGVCLVYSHYYGVFVVLAQNIWFFMELARKKGVGVLGFPKWLLLQGLIVILFLPCSFLLAKNTAAIQKGFWITEPTPSDILGYFTLYAGTSFLLCVFLFFSILAAFGSRLLKHSGISARIYGLEDNNREITGISYGGRISLLLIWIFAVVFIPFIVSNVSSPILIYRYTISAAPAFYILTARGIGGLRMNTAIVLVVALIAGLSIPGLYRYYVEPEKYDWREAAKYIQKEAGHGDFVVTYPKFEVEPAAYYLRRGDLRIGQFSEDLFTYTGIGDNNVWLVVSSHRGLEKNIMKLKMASRFDYVSETEYKGLNVYKYRVKTE